MALIKMIKAEINLNLMIQILFTVSLILSFNTVWADQRLIGTPSATEGPYWKANSPLRGTLYQENDPGKRIQVSGKVLDTSGNYIPGSKIDVWQTNANGEYDNSGYNFRGHVITNSRGEYQFNTVRPGEYPSRTAHIHIKVSTPDGRILTTQLYFPEYSSRNSQDWLYKNQLNVRWMSDTKAEFDFVLE